MHGATYFMLKVLLKVILFVLLFGAASSPFNFNAAFLRTSPTNLDVCFEEHQEGMGRLG